MIIYVQFIITNNNWLYNMKNYLCDIEESTMANEVSKGNYKTHSTSNYGGIFTRFNI